MLCLSFIFKRAKHAEDKLCFSQQINSLLSVVTGKALNDTIHKHNTNNKTLWAFKISLHLGRSKNTCWNIFPKASPFLFNICNCQGNRWLLHFFIFFKTLRGIIFSCVYNNDDSSLLLGVFPGMLYNNTICWAQELSESSDNFQHWFILIPKHSY